MIGVPDARWGEIGCAFIQPCPGTVLKEAAVLAALDGRLGRYKLPRRVRFLDLLPRTATGKVDKPMLARMEAQ